MFVLSIHTNETGTYLFEARDVIEEMLPDRLDISGWDLRKTLRLFSKCNLALYEWLGSPIVYSETPAFRNQLVQLIPHYFNPIAAMHHYRNMASRTLDEHLVDDRLPIKSLFYVLRPLLACRWILQTGSQPPTEFEKLITPNWVAVHERDWIDNLLLQKSRAVEAEPVQLDQVRAEAMRSELERYKSAAELVAEPQKRDAAELDKVLREWTEKRLGI